MATFPEVALTGEPIRPAARSFSIGSYPVKEYRSLGGTIVKRSFGNRPLSYTLDMQFNAVSQSVLEAIYNHYHGQQGVTLGFDLPSSIVTDLSSTMQLNMQQAGGGAWFYVEAPQVESIPSQRVNISVKLVSEIIASIALGS